MLGNSPSNNPFIRSFNRKVMEPPVFFRMGPYFFLLRHRLTRNPFWESWRDFIYLFFTEGYVDADTLKGTRKMHRVTWVGLEPSPASKYFSV